jgi:hypothetical protein
VIGSLSLSRRLVRPFAARALVGLVLAAGLADRDGGCIRSRGHRKRCRWPGVTQIKALITAYSGVRVQPFFGRGLSSLSWATI